MKTEIGTDYSAVRDRVSRYQRDRSGSGMRSERSIDRVETVAPVRRVRTSCGWLTTGSENRLVSTRRTAEPSQRSFLRTRQQSTDTHAEGASTMSNDGARCPERDSFRWAVSQPGAVTRSRRRLRTPQPGLPTQAWSLQLQTPRIICAPRSHGNSSGGAFSPNCWYRLTRPAALSANSCQGPHALNIRHESDLPPRF